MSHSLSPLISVVIPTYEMKGQGVAFLKRCLDSIEKQIGIDPNSIEVVISDQSSDDAIAQFCEAHSFDVQYHKTNSGRGIAAHNLNAGITLAKGMYVKILFQDDLLVEDNYLHAIKNIITRAKPECIISSALHTTDGKVLTNQITPKNNPYFLFGHNTISSPSTITLERSFANKNLFDENLLMLFDCDFYYRIFESNANIKFLYNFNIANGIWGGQSQHGITRKQLTKEIRYLNKKYPNAHLSMLLVLYEALFKKLHPEAPFPFSKNLEPTFFQKIQECINRNYFLHK